MFPFLYSRSPETHKGHYGHALLVAGSLGKMGAAILAARACLRSGVGLLTVHVPRCGVDILQTALPEAMLSIDADDAVFTSLPADLKKYDAVAIGPGLGTDSRSRKALADLLAALQSLAEDGSQHRGIVIDADGLNMLSMMPENLHLARRAVLTPHAMEYQRLFADADTQQMCNLHELIIVRKGHRSSTFAPGIEPVVNSTGNPGMATAGSGDVLTGVILALLAQSRAYAAHGLMPQTASKEYVQKLVAWAVNIHGRAGDTAASRRPQASVMASDIIEALLA